MKRIFPLILLLFLLDRCSVPDRNQPDNEPESGREQSIVDSRPKKLHTEDYKEVPENKITSQTGTKNIRKKSAKINRKESMDYQFAGDSARRTHLETMMKQNSGIDLNEPVSRDYILTTVENQKFRSMITVSREKFLKINFDNDILDYTDRFFTNGIRIELISPVFQYFPFSRLMVPYWKSGMNYYGLALVQNMYTPSTTKVEGILYGDRPYSAYLYLGTFKITNDPISRIRQKSELDIGVIGSYSLGEYVQKSFHNEVPTNTVPVGWEYQIQNDLVLNYNLQYEKGVIDTRHFEMILNGAGSLGTLYTNISGGVMMRTGIQNPYFANLGVQKRKFNKDKGLRDFQFIVFATGRGKLVGYDATLEGGLFNKTSVYTIGADDVSRVVFEGSAGITLVYRGIKVDVEQVLLSPEFHNGWWHKWVHVGLTFAL